MWILEQLPIEFVEVLMVSFYIKIEKLRNQIFNLIKIQSSIISRTH